MDKNFEAIKKLNKKQITKIQLSETAIYWGRANMPKDWHIDKERLIKDITLSNYYEDVSYPFSKTWDMLKTYVCDFMRLEQKIDLSAKKTFGNFYEKNEISKPKLEINFANLNESPDFVCIYGVEIDKDTCNLNLFYNDNRKFGCTWTIPIETNKFIIFPSSLQYYITNSKNTYLNFINTITFTHPGAQGGSM
jgi:hypothetical protein